MAVAVCPLSHYHTAVSHVDANAWRRGPSGELASLALGAICRRGFPTAR